MKLNNTHTILSLVGITSAFNTDLWSNSFDKVQNVLQFNFFSEQDPLTNSPIINSCSEKFLSYIDQAKIHVASNPDYYHYSEIPKEQLPFDIEQYKGQYVIRLHDWQFRSSRDSIILSANELQLDIWETSETNKFIDIEVTKGEGLDLFQRIFESNPDAEFKLDLMVHDLPQIIFETLPIADKNYNNEEGDLKNSAIFGTDLFFKQYRDLATIYNWFDLLAQTYPELLTLEWIGQTFEGRDIKALRLTAHKEKNEDKVKTVVITGGLHAREWVGVSTTCYILSRFLSDYEADKKKVHYYLKNLDFLFLPVMNPDGYDYTWNEDRLWRKNRQETYNPRCFGIDIDHSFDYHFTRSEESSCSEDYAGEGAFESLESYSWDKYLNETKHDHPIYGYIDLHSYAQEVLYPYAYTCDQAPRDKENLLELAYGLSQSIRLRSGKNYGVVSACEDKGADLLPSMGAGSALDYMYHNKAHWAFVLKLRDSGSHGFLLPPKYIVPVGKEIYDSIKYFAQFVLSDD